MKDNSDWEWEKATPKERADFIRQHTGPMPRSKLPLSREQLCELFILTPEGLQRILDGEDWRTEYEVPPPAASAKGG